MENLGALAVLLAFCFSVFAIAASVIGGWKRRPFLIAAAERAVYSILLLTTVASFVLVSALLAGDFRFSYVAAHSNLAMPVLYKFAAWWGGQEGSLLFWSWLLSCYSAVVVYTNRRKHRRIMPYVTATLMVTQCFFLILNAFVASPFEMLAVGRGITAVPDGQGLNPLLQHPAMAVHPPVLYLGYVGFVVPFAFAMGSLITRQPGDDWIHTTRRWTLITWLFQTSGIVIGAAWAYVVLGWGGYWGWDPVENASFLPWITATAFLHSVMMQEKKGMMKVWNMVLVSATFFLCIFGTFLTRSGIVSSVHAFAQSSIGHWFIGFMAATMAVTAYLILDRLDYLKTEARLESVISRESSFMFNNLILLAAAFAILWGTMFPVISEAVTGEKISVGPPFFNRIMVPIGLFLLFLTGVGPLFAWRRTSLESLRRNFQWPLLGALALAAGLFAAGVRHGYALTALGLCLFVAWTIIAEFYRGSRAIAAKSGTGLLRSAVELTRRNTRRYGGYIVHFGIVLMYVGFSGAAFNTDTTQEVRIGDHIRLGSYELRVADVRQGDNPNYTWHTARIDVTKNGRSLGSLTPERRFYKASQQGTSEVAIRRRLNEDLYLNFAGMSDDNQRAIIQAFVFPLVSWIWIGYWVLVAGTLICLVPSKVRPRQVRTQVAGVRREHAAAV
ncbi:MAG TPA: heme lyase CcmF/NrfE family subunit [Bryobacteraceae bacterium]|nr:heme lyase CcmF/NrfE family subunit [Bryobacteraceae bacterium]HOQ47123.1 heme lyase CcmF/NrfE family subunit [Bryobacteraceae bacterium]HPU72490.1 heme lyase CcmF/NrfE family subunit [Bryobacteraceae bacterium]